MINQIKNIFSGHVHQHIIEQILLQLPEDKKNDFFVSAVECYQKYRTHKSLMRHHNVYLESYFHKTYDNEPVYTNKNFESFSDDVEKTLIKHEVDSIIHRIKTSKTESFFTEEVKQIIEDLVSVGFSKNEVQEFLGKKINSFQCYSDFKNALHELFEQRINWKKSFVFDNIKKHNLIENKDYVILYEDDMHLNIEIITYKASKALGVRMWCLVRELNYFKDYREYSKQFIVFSYDFTKDYSELNSIVASLFDVNLKIVDCYLKNDDYWDADSEISGFDDFKNELQSKSYTSDVNWTTSFLKCLNDPYVGNGFAIDNKHDFHNNAYIEKLFTSFSYSLDNIPKEVIEHESVIFNHEVDKENISIYEINKINNMNNNKINKDYYDPFSKMFTDRIHFSNLSEDNTIKLFLLIKDDQLYIDDGVFIQFFNNAIRNKYYKLANFIIDEHLKEFNSDFRHHRKLPLFKNTFHLILNEETKDNKYLATKMLLILSSEEKGMVLTDSLEAFDSIKTTEEKSEHIAFVKQEMDEKLDPRYIYNYFDRQTEHNHEKLFKLMMSNPEELLDLFKIENKFDLFCIFDILFSSVTTRNPKEREAFYLNIFDRYNKKDEIHIFDFNDKSHSFNFGTTGKGKTAFNPFSQRCFSLCADLRISVLKNRFSYILGLLKNTLNEDIVRDALTEFFSVENDALLNLLRLSTRLADDDELIDFVQKSIGFFESINIPINKRTLSKGIMNDKDASKTSSFLVYEDGFSIGKIKCEEVVNVVNSGSSQPFSF